MLVNRFEAGKNGILSCLSCHPSAHSQKRRYKQIARSTILAPKPRLDMCQRSIP